jgi:hypothetical protein
MTKETETDSGGGFWNSITGSAEVSISTRNLWNDEDTKDSNETESSGEEENDEDAEDSDEEEPADTQALEQTLQDTRAYLDLQVETLNQFDDQATQSLRLNLLVYGLLFTIIALFTRSGQPVEQRLQIFSSLLVPPLLGGVVATLTSIIAAFWVLNTSDAIAGLSPQSVDIILSEEPSYPNFLKKLTKGRKSWIEHNRDVNKKDAGILVTSYLLLFLEIMYFTVTPLWIFYSLPRNGFLANGLSILFALIPIVLFILLTPVWRRVTSPWNE